MVKLRDARCCNLKLRIFLVIYGRLVEPGIRQSRAALSGVHLERKRNKLFVFYQISCIMVEKGGII